MLRFTGELCDLCQSKLFRTEFLGQDYCNNPECERNCLGFILGEGDKIESIPKSLNTPVAEKPRKTFEEMRQEMLIRERIKSKRKY